MSRPRIGELFSGYGGLGAGVQAVLGGSIAWHSEIDPGACKILAHRYPDVPNHGDITAIDWAAVEPVDVLTGGSPCQDLSAAGKRAGMTEGTRSNLWVSMREAIAQLRPGLVVWENVRGALSARASSDMELAEGRLGAGDDGPVLRALGRVLGDLADIGYDASWQGLRASDVGAPHGRFRVFVIAWPADSHRSGLEGADEQGWQGAASGQRSDSHARRRFTARCAGSAAADSNGPGRWGLEELHCVSESDGESGGDGDDADGLAVASGGLDWGVYTDAIRRWERLTRPAPDPLQYGKTKQPRLAPAFSEWLMGLPAGWVTDVPGLSRSEQLKALGNGVVPQQAAEALRLLLPDVELAVAA